MGIGHTSCLLAECPGMGIVSSSDREAIDRRTTGPLFGPHDVLERSRTYPYVPVHGRSDVLRRS
jgi:hypothetical protein